MRCNITIKDYWSLTLGEIVIYINSYMEQQREQKENSLYLSYQTAALTAAFVNNSMAGKKIPAFYEIFPDSNVAVQMKEQEEHKQMQVLEAKMQALAISFNNRKGGK